MYTSHCSRCSAVIGICLSSLSEVTQLYGSVIQLARLRPGGIAMVGGRSFMRPVGVSGPVVSEVVSRDSVVSAVGVGVRGAKITFWVRFSRSRSRGRVVRGIGRGGREVVLARVGQGVGGRRVGGRRVVVDITKCRIGVVWYRKRRNT